MEIGGQIAGFGFVSSGVDELRIAHRREMLKEDVSISREFSHALGDGSHNLGGRDDPTSPQLEYAPKMRHAFSSEFLQYSFEPRLKHQHSKPCDKGHDIL